MCVDILYFYSYQKDRWFLGILSRVSCRFSGVDFFFSFKEAIRDLNEVYTFMGCTKD